MSFLVKGVIKKILEQYLNIKDQIDLEKGSILLPNGHLNHSKINNKIQELNLQVCQSLYKNLSLSIPIIDIMTKPIFLKVQKLQIVLEYKKNPIQNHQVETATVARQSGSDSYLKVIANRLLMNIEVEIESLEVTIKKQDSQVVHQGFIQKFKVKNSLSFLNVNLLRKIVYLGQLSLATNDGSIKVKDLNLCLNLDDKKIGLIMLVQTIALTAKQEKLLMKLKEKLVKREKKQENESQKAKYFIEQMEIKIHKLTFLLESQNSMSLRGVNVEFCSKNEEIFFGGHDIHLISHENQTILSLVAEEDEEEKAKTKMKHFKIEINSSQNEEQKIIKIRSIGLNFNLELLVDKALKYKNLKEKLFENPQNMEEMDKEKSIPQIKLKIQNSAISPIFPNSNVKIQILLFLDIYLNNQLQQINIHKFLIQTNGFQALLIEGFQFSHQKNEIVLLSKSIKACINPQFIHNLIQLLQNNKSFSKIQDMIENQKSEKNQKKNELTPSIFYKLERITIELGVTDLQSAFFPIFQLQFYEMKGKYSKNKITVKTQIQHLTAFSPHDLSIAHICKNIRIVGEKKDKSFSMTIVDPISVQITEEILILVLSLVQRKALLLNAKNEIKDQITIEQKNPLSSSFFNFNTSFSVEPGSKRNIFFTENPSSLVISIKGEKSRILPLEYGKKPKQLDINFSYHEQSQHVLQLYENQLTIKYKFELTLYDKIGNNKIKKIEIINTNNDNEQIKMMAEIQNTCRFTWELLEDEKIGFLKIYIQYKKEIEFVNYRVGKLMANHQSYRLYGLYKESNPKHFYHYILETPKKEGISASSYVLMPFLVLKNNLNVKLILKIVCKKTSQELRLDLNAFGQFDSLGNKFDFYMKQYVFQITWEENGEIYQSDEHYFNTFFMIDEQFQTLIELRDEKMNKKHIRICESFLHKTKVFEFNTSFEIQNKMDYAFQLSMKNRDQQEYFSSQLSANSLSSYKNMPGKDDFIYVMFEGKHENTVQISMKNLVTSSLLLSFNFCKINDTEKYYHILVKVTLDNIHCHQKITFSPFIIVHNFCTYSFSIQQSLIKCRQSFSLSLPSSTSNEYNNKCLKLSVEETYEQLFNEKSNQILFTGEEIIEIEMESGEKLKFNELIINKLVESECKGRRVVYYLLKNLKDDCIEFYLSDKLYNSSTSSINYFLFNNQTQNYFLMSSDTHYAQYFLKQSKNAEENSHETIFLRANSFSSMLNKEKYDIFLCDEEKKNLHPLSISKLQKMHTKLERYTMQNFTVVNLLSDTRYEDPLFQLNTKRITIKLVSSKNNKKDIFGLGLDLKFLNLRILQPQKIDILLRDVTLTCNQNENQDTKVLRIADESYMLLEGKIIAEKFCLLKNFFLKCKIVDVHFTKHFLQTVLYFSRFFHQFGEKKENSHQKQKKIMNIIEQKVVLIKSMHLHSMNLCLSTDINNLDFSNMIVLPQLEMSSRSYRIKNLMKDISNHYLTNILAKFPKLSFIFQNLRNPLGTIRSLLEARELFKEESHQRNFIYLKENWSHNNHINKINKLANINKYINNHISLKSGQNDENQFLLCYIKNAIYNNIANLGAVNYYYLTNINIHMISYEEKTTKFSCKSFPLKIVSSAKIMKYNKKDGQLIIEFKRKMGYLKIVDKISTCEHILMTIQKVLF